jgi:2-polyprenyl-3-methyl-5-hydroxy-6-metoxy-1,4-benzoquinol methylase
MTENKIIENHKRYLERIALYRQHGYDMDQERSFVLERASPVSGNILEAGTGKGYFSLALAREGHSFTTFDISAEEQWFAGLNLAYYGLTSYVRFDVADAERLPYNNAFFDIIFAVNMIHHLPSVRNVCDEFIRILSPSGKMVLSDFNTQGFAVVDKVHALEGKRHEVSDGTLNEVKTILTESGFKVEEHHGANQDVLVASRV